MKIKINVQGNANNIVNMKNFNNEQYFVLNNVYQKQTAWYYLDQQKKNFESCTTSHSIWVSLFENHFQAKNKIASEQKTTKKWSVISEIKAMQETLKTLYTVVKTSRVKDSGMSTEITSNHFC